MKSMKYTLKVIKREEEKGNSPMDRLVMHDSYDRTIFIGELDSDATIEILQHLHDLSSRKLTE